MNNLDTLEDFQEAFYSVLPEPTIGSLQPQVNATCEQIRSLVEWAKKNRGLGSNYAHSLLTRPLHRKRTELDNCFVRAMNGEITLQEAAQTIYDLTR